MPDNNSTSLVNLGKLSKPANTLIKKVSAAVGGIFEPWQIKRIASAKAEAGLIEAKASIEITDLHRRAMHRFVEEEARRQENMEQITKKTIPQLEKDSDPESMEDDWITNFFEKSRIISDDEMQELWSRILAGEANAPGTYSKRTVNLLGDLDKRDAELFRSLCKFGWIVNTFTPLIFDHEAAIYSNEGLNFNSLNHLESLGLIHFSPTSGYKRTRLPSSITVEYCGHPLTLTLPQVENNDLTLGQVLLTQAGTELAFICRVQGVKGFEEYVKEKWQAYLPSEDDT